MSYYDIPHTRIYDQDLGWLIQRYFELNEDFIQLLDDVKAYKAAIDEEVAEFEEYVENEITTFEEYIQNEWDTYAENLRTEWVTYQTALNEDWEDYQTELNNEWNAYQEEMDSAWSDYQTTMNNAWTEYYTNLNSEWSTYEENLRTEWVTYQATLNELWSDYQTSLSSEWASYQSEMNTAWTEYYTNLNSEWSTYEENLRTEWVTYQATLNNEWSSLVSTWESYQSDMNTAWSEYQTTINSAWSTWQSEFESTYNTYITNLEADWSEYKSTLDGLYEDLKTWLESQLSDENLQSLINSQLDEWYSDGTLTTIIETYVNTYLSTNLEALVETEVTEQLSEYDLENISSNLTTLQESVSTNTTNISTNASDIDSLEERMDTAEDDIDSLESSLASLTSELNSMATNTVLWYKYTTDIIAEQASSSEELWETGQAFTVLDFDSYEDVVTTISYSNSSSSLAGSVGTADFSNTSYISPQILTNKSYLYISNNNIPNGISYTITTEYAFGNVSYDIKHTKLIFDTNKLLIGLNIYNSNNNLVGWLISSDYLNHLCSLGIFGIVNRYSDLGSQYTTGFQSIYTPVTDEDDNYLIRYIWLNYDYCRLAMNTQLRIYFDCYEFCITTTNNSSMSFQLVYDDYNTSNVLDSNQFIDGTPYGVITLVNKEENVTQYSTANEITCRNLWIRIFDNGEWNDSYYQCAIAFAKKTPSSTEYDDNTVVACYINQSRNPELLTIYYSIPFGVSLYQSYSDLTSYSGGSSYGTIGPCICLSATLLNSSNNIDTEIPTNIADLYNIKANIVLDGGTLYYSNLYLRPNSNTENKINGFAFDFRNYPFEKTTANNQYINHSIIKVNFISYHYQAFACYTWNDSSYYDGSAVKYLIAGWFTTFILYGSTKTYLISPSSVSCAPVLQYLITRGEQIEGNSYRTLTFAQSTSDSTTTAGSFNNHTRDATLIFGISNNNFVISSNTSLEMQTGIPGTTLF